MFFPDYGTDTQIFLVFGVFAAGFISRPLGSLFFGHIGDKYGRRFALFFSVILMSAPVGLVAVLPTYQQVGIAATFCLTIIRILQGFALGGEAGNAVFLMECSPKNRIGFYGSFEVISALIGAFLSTLVILICKLQIGDKGFEQWGWRLPFLFGAAVGILGSFLRYQTKESPEFIKKKELTLKLPAKQLFAKHKTALLTAIGIDGLEEASLYMFLIFIQGYFATNLAQVSTSFLHYSHILLLILLAALTLCSALLSDLVGRVKVLFFAFAFAIFASYPALIILDSGSLLGFIAGQIIIVIIIAFSLGPISAAVFEILPTEVSYTGLALSRNISAAVFGGLAPTFCMLLTQVTKSKASAGFYLVFCGIIGIASLTFFKKLHKKTTNA